jgi:aldehyde dehydrogenase (NAD+)
MRRFFVFVILLSIFSGGHALLVGVPGLAKTLMVNTIAQTLGLNFKRIQFTPDLMPSDVTGHVVFADAKIEDAVNGAVSGIFAATGQTCIAGSRLLLQESIHDAFVEKLLALAKTARMGNPMSLETQVGPVTTRPQYDKVLSYIDIARNEGAKLRMGGGPATRPECGKGWFVEPTIFTGVDNRMRIAQEEVFGPVLSIIPFKDEDDAVRIGNDVRFGLGAGVWTQDVGRAIRMSERIKAGTVWVNTYRAVSFMSPFGGYKDSGMGRENGASAIYEYLQMKSVWINTGVKTGNPFVMR